MSASAPTSTRRRAACRITLNGCILLRRCFVAALARMRPARSPAAITYGFLAQRSADPRAAARKRRSSMSEVQLASPMRQGEQPATPLYDAPVVHPGAWQVSDFKSPADYTIELDNSQLGDLERAIAGIRKAGLGLDDLQREHF